MTNFWVKITIILSVLAEKFFLLFKNKIIYKFLILWLQKMVGHRKKISPPLLVLLLDLGFGIHDG
jgi:hypothetical protein